MEYGVKQKRRGEAMKYKFTISIFLLLAVLTISFSSQADSGNELIVNFSTEKITLLAGNSRIIPFSILNNSTGTIRITDIAVSSDTDFLISKMTLQSYELESMKMVEGSFEIIGSETINSTGQLSLIVKYELLAPDTLTPIAYVKYFPIEYEIITYPNIDELIEVKIHSEDSFIYEGSFKNIILEIRNISSTPIVVDQISFLNSGYITAYPESCVLDAKTVDDQCVPNSLLPSSITLMPGQDSLLPIYLNLSESYPHRNIQSIFIFDIIFDWGEIQISQKLNSEYTVNAGSFEGEKDILNLFGIPIYLLLPGFICLSLFQFFRKTNSLFNDNKPVFWLFTIIISILIQWFYKTKIISTWYKGDLLTNFNTTDLFSISVISAILGSIFALFSYIIQQIKTPSQKDSPLTIIFKIVFLNLSYSLPTFTFDDGEKVYFEILQGNKSNTDIWYCPPIIIESSNKEKIIDKWINRKRNPLKQKTFFSKLLFLCEILYRKIIIKEIISISWKYTRVDHFDPNQKKFTREIKAYLIRDKDQET
ncbi:MAG: hypothetical protein ACYC59_07970 [Anaerolineaceae bacterium]